MSPFSVTEIYLSIPSPDSTYHLERSPRGVLISFNSFTGFHVALFMFLESRQVVTFNSFTGFHIIFLGEERRGVKTFNSFTGFHQTSFGSPTAPTKFIFQFLHRIPLPIKSKEREGPELIFQFLHRIPRCSGLKRLRNLICGIFQFLHRIPRN